MGMMNTVDSNMGGPTDQTSDDIHFLVGAQNLQWKAMYPHLREDIIYII